MRLRRHRNPQGSRSRPRDLQQHARSSRAPAHLQLSSEVRVITLSATPVARSPCCSRTPPVPSPSTVLSFPCTTIPAQATDGEQVALSVRDVKSQAPRSDVLTGRRRQLRRQRAQPVRAADAAMMEAPLTQGRGGDTLVKRNTVLVVGGTGTLGRQVRGWTRCRFP